MRKVLIVVGSICLLAAACKSKATKESPVESLADMKELSEKVKEQTDASTSKMEARKAKGDTLAMAYRDLQAFLPDISGYTRDGDPKGSQMNMPGLGSWSQAEQKYKDGDKTIRVEMVDYNGAYGAFTGVTAIYAMGFSSEDEEKKQGSADLGIKDVAAYESIYKKEQRGELAVIAGGRFFIQLRSEGSNDPQVLYTAAKSIRLAELAAK